MTTTQPTSHALAKALLELPDLPIVCRDYDGQDFLVDEVAVDEAEINPWPEGCVYWTPAIRFS